MFKKENYYQHSGWISNGPSRESMFDSLRLGTIIDICFICTNRVIIDRRAIITSIGKKDYHSKRINDEWKVELLFEKKYGSNKMTVSWEGFYSTKSREGQLTGKLPKCLIA